MPFFSRKFRHRKTPARKKLNFHAEEPRRDLRNGPIALSLGNQEFKFDDGEWKKVLEDGVDYKKALKEQQDLCCDLREENNLLKIKLEILLDMLTMETTKALEKKCRPTNQEEINNREL